MFRHGNKQTRLPANYARFQAPISTWRHRITWNRWNGGNLGGGGGGGYVGIIHKYVVCVGEVLQEEQSRAQSEWLKGSINHV